MDVIGGGVLVAAAAALWITYLLPSWLRRRQYLATERNAVRLQQTLRILAETAEMPEPVRLEATAREVATQQRILHEHETTARLEAEAAEHLAIAERRAAEGAADAARELAAEAIAAHPVTEPIAVITPASAAAARRALRRKRALCSLTFLASLVVAVAGLIAAAFGGSLLVPAAGGLGMVLGFSGIVRLAKRRVPRAVVPVSVEREAVSFEPIELPEEPAATEGWTPQPLPRPLHLSRGTIAATAMASIEAAAELKRSASEAEITRRTAQLEPDVPDITPTAAPAPAAASVAQRSVSAAGQGAHRALESANPYAGMGIVGDAKPAFDDLDAVLRRRRQAG
ncbi:hypothetical protein J7E25_03130 [Agromyces sp. ISL-38]|uniref:hypothetical protein n=1 Tax=Agromyces sp. ISL-38 TaxID=2819107 RepID=UPI001BE8E602|nr:hypothetical protein [Agromyces sp. ISL-38]MBT2498080.1 hypothetical protein [Agromyces sp. ISL-38]